jgi:hypothetical protein
MVDFRSEVRLPRPTLDTLASELERRMVADLAAAWPDREFDALALAAFRLQFESIESYRNFCVGRGQTPDSVRGWREVPAVPATAFKHVDFVVDDSKPPEAVFRTSGSTRGAAARGRHLVPRVSLYRGSLEPPFRTHVLSGLGRVRFLSLIPSPQARPDSSLSFMVGAVVHLASDVRWLVDGGGAFDEVAWRDAAGEASSSGEPVVVLATSLALLHLVEVLEQSTKSTPSPLPAGSRIMETGGFKGSGREIARDELHRRVEATTGVPPHRIIGEYGMTELLSQLYEPVLAEGSRSAGTYVPPPWLRVHALDPMTLDELPEGAEGVLAFFDLANVGSLCHVLTEDIGSVEEGRIRLMGRARGAEPRGCSLAMDEIMSAARGVAPREGPAS